MLPVNGMVFSLDVKRDTSYFKYKVIFPLVLIVMMSWMVFWIDPSLVATQISVSVTAMLTMIAYRFRPRRADTETCLSDQPGFLCAGLDAGCFHQHDTSTFYRPPRH